MKNTIHELLKPKLVIIQSLVQNNKYSVSYPKTNNFLPCG